MSDEAVVEQFKATRDPACFGELFRRHKKNIYRACFAVLKNAAAAEDLTQETFTTAFVKIDLFRNRIFYAWLSTIARHLCLNYLKSSMAAREITNGISDEAASPTDLEATHRLTQEVRTILGQLPERQRICLKLFYMEGHTYKEIAELTGYTEKEVKSYIQNGRRRFELAWYETQNGGK